MHAISKTSISVLHYSNRDFSIRSEKLPISMGNLQRSKVHRQAHVNLLKFSKAKCKGLHLDWGNFKQKKKKSLGMSGLGTALRRTTWRYWLMRDSV